MESISRASLSSIVPIQAYDLLKDKQGVSVLYFVIGVVGIAATLYAPKLFRPIPRRYVYTIGALTLVAASAALATNTLAGQAAGMFLRVFGAATLAIVLNLYIMEYIPKHGLVRSKSLRLALSTISWSLGPTFGVWLYVRFGPVAPYLWSASWALILIAIFWYFRLSNSTAISPGPLRPADPIANIRRFVAQPRMRLAWMIAFGRSCYWATFFIYAPILMVATGEGKLAGGIVVSLGNALLLFAIGWGRLGSRFGVRPVIVLAFAAAAVSAFVAGICRRGASVERRGLASRRHRLRGGARCRRERAVPARRPCLRAPADDSGLPHLSRHVGAGAAARLFGDPGVHRPRRRLCDARRLLRRLRMALLAAPPAIDVG